MSEAYSLCADTKPRQTVMASSSLAPMRRNRISCLPSLVLKYHLPFFLTRGIGSGHSCSPTMMYARFGLDLASSIEFLAAASLAKACALALSWTVSSDATTSWPSGPRIASNSDTSNAPVALMSASAACSGVTKVFWLAAAVLAAGWACAMPIVVNMQHRPTRTRTIDVIRSFLVNILAFISPSLIMICLSTGAFRRHRHGSRRHRGSRPCWRSRASCWPEPGFHSYRCQPRRRRCDCSSSDYSGPADYQRGRRRHHDLTCRECPHWDRFRGQLRPEYRRLDPPRGSTYHGRPPAAAAPGSAGHSPDGSAWNRHGWCRHTCWRCFCRHTELRRGAAGCVANCCYPYCRRSRGSRH